jgi:antitoxin HicB
MSKAYKKKALTPNAHRGSQLDEFLREEGTLYDMQTRAIKEVLAWQISEAMKAKKMSRKRLAEDMGTSRTQIGRLLNPEDGNVTLQTLERAAKVIGGKIRLELFSLENGKPEPRRRAVREMNFPDSEALISAVYDPKRRVLRATFRQNERVYEYLDVPRREYQNLIHAQSRGTYMNQNIKPRYRFREVTIQKRDQEARFKAEA